MASHAESKKRNKYKLFLPIFNFSALAVESSGIFGKELTSLVNTLGKRISDRTGEPRSTSFLFQRISLDVQRGNAEMILSGLLANPSNMGDEVFVDDDDL